MRKTGLHVRGLPMKRIALLGDFVVLAAAWALASARAGLPSPLPMVNERATLARARRQALERGLTCAAYVRAMFETGHDAANQEAFRSEPVENPWISLEFH
jgi:hypothetical protein